MLSVQITPLTSTSRIYPRVVDDFEKTLGMIFSSSLAEVLFLFTSDYNETLKGGFRNNIEIYHVRVLYDQIIDSKAQVCNFQGKAKVNGAGLETVITEIQCAAESSTEGFVYKDCGK